MKILKIVGVVLGVLLLGAGGSFLYAKRAAAQRLDETYEVRVEPIPIPFPLSQQEIANLRKGRATTTAQPASNEAGEGAEAPAADGSAPAVEAPAPTGAEPTAAQPAAAQPAAAQPAAAQPAAAQPAAAQPAPTEPTTANGDAATDTDAADPDATAEAAKDPLAGVDLKALALQRAVARGKRYLTSRAACSDCHGEDFGGKVIVDHPMMGKWVAPNITRGGLTKNYRSEDWVRILRHGIKPDGKPATMPSLDFTWFSDQEISDIAAYISQLPAVDRVMPPSDFGPVFAFLMAFGENQISAEFLDHTTKRSVYPPSTSRASQELGKHLAATCMGCHGANLAGGPIPGGDPSWPPAANLTPDESGLGKWSLADFQRAMREGKRPDGRQLDAVMPLPYTKNLKDTEIESLYLYLKTLPKVPTQP